MEHALRASLGAAPQPVDRDVLVPASIPWWHRPRISVPLTIGLAMVLAILLSQVPALWNGALEVEASLYRLGEGTEERLLPGTSVSPGDQLFLEIQGSRAMHVYVINEDAAGRAFVLFPLPELELQNPLPSEMRHRLPGPFQGKDVYWDVTTVGQQETILVVASVNPLDRLEGKLAGFPRAAATHSLPVPPQEIADSLLRGIAGISPGPVETPRPGPGYLSQVFRDLSSRAAGSDGLWFWEVQLENPGF
jgi:hypothetical protein